MLDSIFDGFVEAHHEAGESTAKVLTGLYRRHAVTQGVPPHLARDLHVAYDPATLAFDYHLPAELEPLEYGDLTHPPVAFRRKAMSAHSALATRMYDHYAGVHHNPPVL